MLRVKKNALYIHFDCIIATNNDSSICWSICNPFD